MDWDDYWKDYWKRVEKERKRDDLGETIFGIFITFMLIIIMIMTASLPVLMVLGGMGVIG